MREKRLNYITVTTIWGRIIYIFAELKQTVALLDEDANNFVGILQMA